jgi:hypothetical protein
VGPIQDTDQGLHGRCPVCGEELSLSMPSSEDAHQLFGVIRRIDDVAIGRAKQRGIQDENPNEKGGA